MGGGQARDFFRGGPVKKTTPYILGSFDLSLRASGAQRVLDIAVGSIFEEFFSIPESGNLIRPNLALKIIR